MTSDGGEKKAPGPDLAIFPEEQIQRFPIGDRELIVRPLVIADYRRAAATIGAVLTRVAVEHPEIELTEMEKHLEAVAPIMVDCVGPLVERLFGMEADFVENNVTGAQALAIINALLEVNDLAGMVGNARGILQQVAASRK